MSNVLKIERDSLCNLQKEIYLPKNKTENVGTRFSMDLDKRSYASHIKEKLSIVPSDKGEITYTASTKYDSLLNVTAFINLFTIRVKDKYKDKISICYHHNLGHNILYSGVCKIDKEHFGFLDSKILDIHAQFFVKKREIYNEMIGNIPCFENWGTFLPKKTLIVPQPFSFSRNTRVSLPLLKSSNDVTFEYKTRLELSDLIKMRALVTPAVWDDSGNLSEEAIYKEIKFNYNYLDTNGQKNIPIPELWGRYSEMSDEERNWRKSIDETTGQPRKQIIYIEDFELAESTNPTPIGSRVEIPIGASSPAKHIFWMAGLVDTGYSNYTTNKDNLFQGWNPCAISGIKYGTSYRVTERSHEHFDISEAYEFNWPNTPCEGGYNVHTFTFNPIEIQAADTTVILKQCGATLTVKLEDTNPFLTEDEEDYDEKGEIILKELIENESKKDNYMVHVRTMVVCKIEIYWDDKTGKLKYNIIPN